MNHYLISYELRDPEFDYEPLYTALHTIEAKHIHDSVWGVNTRSSAQVLFEYLWCCVRAKSDRLFVVTFDKTRDYKAGHSITELKDL